MVAKILCVAEKPSIAKAVANHLGSSVSVVGQQTILLNESMDSADGHQEKQRGSRLAEKLRIQLHLSPTMGRLQCGDDERGGSHQLCRL